MPKYISLSLFRQSTAAFSVLLSKYMYLSQQKCFCDAQATCLDRESGGKTSALLQKLHTFCGWNTLVKKIDLSLHLHFCCTCTVLCWKIEFTTSNQVEGNQANGVKNNVVCLELHSLCKEKKFLKNQNIHYSQFPSKLVLCVFCKYFVII